MLKLAGSVQWQLPATSHGRPQKQSCSQPAESQLNAVVDRSNRQQRLGELRPLGVDGKPRFIGAPRDAPAAAARRRAETADVGER